MARLAGLLVDPTPLRESRQYRLLFAGQLVSATGSQMTLVAAPLQVYQLSQSSLAVGLLGLTALVPLVAASIVGGALADAHDRRRLLLVAQGLLAATSAGLLLNALSSSPRLWLIFVLTGLQAAFTGLDMPTRTAALPTLVRTAILPSALALNQLMWQVCQVVGPVAGGVLVGQVSTASVYAVDTATFAVATGCLLAMRPLRPEGGGTRASVSSVAEGLRYLRGQRALVGTFVVDINAMVFGMPRALFPAIGLGAFGSAEAAGLLYSAPAAGAMVAAATSGWLHRIERQGLAVIIAVALWGGAVAVFGLVPWLWAALLLLALAGAADVVSAVFRNSILQTTVPDRLRGRLSAVFIAVVAGGPRLGDAEAGLVGQLFGPQVSVVSGGLACIAGAGVIARLLPELTRWNRREHGPAEGDDGPGDADDDPGAAVAVETGPPGPRPSGPTGPRASSCRA